MANLDWKSKTKGAEIDNLMEALGYLSDTGTRRHSKYIASYKKQLLGTVNKTVTGFYTEQWRVTLNFSQKEFNDWDRIGFEFAIPYKYGQVLIPKLPD